MDQLVTLVLFALGLGVAGLTALIALYLAFTAYDSYRSKQAAQRLFTTAGQVVMAAAAASFLQDLASDARRGRSRDAESLGEQLGGRLEALTRTIKEAADKVPAPPRDE